MRHYTIEVSEPVYQLLNQQANKQNSSLENILERLLVIAPLFLPESNKTTVKEAIAAVQRLSMLFSDVKIVNLEEVLNDPMLELSNSDLDFGLI
jgi:negative regulator of replication initiation